MESLTFAIPNSTLEHSRLGRVEPGRKSYRSTRSASGISLIETVIALLIIGTGLLTLGAAMAGGLLFMGSSQKRLIAKEKASEAIESVFTARDTRTIPWTSIRNTAAGGVFSAVALPINDPGADGLVNTADDGSVQNVRAPGPDGILGNSDDILAPLSGYTRQIVITDLDINLRQITVTVTYAVGKLTQQYTLVTYITPYA